VLAALARWQELLRRQYAIRGGAAAMQAVEFYILKITDLVFEQLHAAMRRLAGPEAGNSIMSTYDQLIAQGRLEGIAKGRAEGRAEGKAEGKAETVLRLLRHRFGDIPAAIERRVASATIDELDRWADRILDVPTLDAVFAG
jgi:hypothetical protein